MLWLKCRRHQIQPDSRRAPEVVAPKNHLVFNRLDAAGLVLRLGFAPGFSERQHRSVLAMA